MLTNRNNNNNNKQKKHELADGKFPFTWTHQ